MTNPNIPKTKTSRVGQGLLYAALVFFLLGVISFITALNIRGWNALLPLFFALVFGAIAIVLAIVGQILKSVGKVAPETLTAEQRAKRTKVIQRNFGIFAAISAGIAILCCFTLLAPVDEINAKVRSLNNIIATAPNGIDFSLNDEGSIRLCNRTEDGSCYTDSIFEGASSLPHPPREFCKLVFDWVSKNDVTTWSNGFRRFAFKKDDPEVTLACTSGHLIFLAGKSGKYPWELAPDMFEPYGYFELYTYVQDQGELTDYDTFVKEWKPYDRVQDQMFTILNDIGAWRKAHPNAKNDETNILEAVKSAKLKKVQVFSKNNEATYIAFENAVDPSQVMCLSVKKFDETYFGVKDPGHGYYPINITPSNGFNQFGYVSATGCGQD